MSFCGKCLFRFKGNPMHGYVYAYRDRVSEDPRQLIKYFENCDKSKISDVLLIDDFFNDVTPDCNVYISMNQGKKVNITITTWQTDDEIFATSMPALEGERIVEVVIKRGGKNAK